MTTQHQIARPTSTTRHTARLSPIVLAVATAFAMTACGGGGGGGMVRNDPPPPNNPNPPPPPPQPKCEDPRATNYGGSLPCVYRYNGPQDNALVVTNADLAHQAGATGAGVKIGLLDDRPYLPYAPLDGQIAWTKDYTGHASDTDTSPITGHGTFMAALLAGKPVGTVYGGKPFNGGLAPDAKLYWGVVCFANACWSQYVAAAVTDMGALGVRLFNASIGKYSGASNMSDASAWAQSVGAAVLAVDGLIAHSTGNDSAPDAGAPALAPAADPRLKDHWFAVTAVAVDSQGNVTGKSSYANPCGSAKDWCLAAPGYTMVPGIAGTAFANGLGDGTSGATAQVTGVAALVWGKFPWMSASNVQQTVLTTATDLGDPGVDAVYGWGLVNAAKAIKGPAQFLGTFDANVTGNSTFSNPISGDGGLHLTGTGTLTLSANNTYTGGTVVDAGTLLLTGKLGSSVTVNGGTFASKGGQITGDYTVKPGATTALQVGTGLSITGNANLAGGLQLLPEPQGYQVKPTETLLTAGQVNGTFGNVTYGSGFFWTATLSYTPTQVNATLTRASAAASAAAASAPTIAVEGGRIADTFLGAVDSRSLAGIATANEQAMAARLASAPTAELAAVSLASITGEVYGAARTAAVQQAFNTTNVLADRVRDLAQHADSGVWVQASGNTGTLNRDGYSRTRYGNSGLTVGVDYALDDGLAVGAALHAGHEHAALDGLAGRYDGTQSGISAYAKTQVGTHGYVAGSLDYRSGDRDVKREVLIGSTTEQVAGTHRDSALTARIEAGLTLPSGLMPYVGAGVLRQRQGGIAEQGGSGFGLLAGADTAMLRFADVGLRFDQQIGAWTFGLDGQYRRLFGTPDLGYSAAFAGAPTDTFRINGLPFGRDAFRVGARALYRLRDGVMLFGTVGAEQGASQGRNGYANVGLKVAF